MNNKTILVTGGLGYIGSHTVTLLLEKGYKVVILDNLYNSSKNVLVNIEKIVGRLIDNCEFIEVDITDKYTLGASLRSYIGKISSCIHFAGYKAVGESVYKPFLYYNNNIVGTINLLEILDIIGCQNVVFSSSATVYGIPEKVPIDETSKTGFLNPYGCSKLVVENILESLGQSVPGKNKHIVSLRYFNPIGAHPSGLLGEDPNDIPNNLLPFIMNVVSALDDNNSNSNSKDIYSHLKVYGNDYDTIDGTGERDYIHVMDLAKAHILALENIIYSDNLSKNYYVCNVGLGKSTSVLEMVGITSKLIGKQVPFKFYPRRTGDCATVYADDRQCRELLKFIPDYTIQDAIKHSLEFIKNKNV